MSHSTSGAPESQTQVLLISDCCPSQMRKRATWSVDQFHVLKKLGSGYASSVYLGTCRSTGVQVAIKMYHKSKLSELNYFQISREIRIHSALDHQNILQLWAAFEDAHGVYLISEYAAKGDVFSNVEKRGGSISEAEAVRQIVYPFLCALQYLHGNNIIHRDIKPENLLLTAMGVLKVADFGLSINVAEERPVTRVGTLDYMSPEVVTCPDKAKPHENKELKHLHYTNLVDAWAIGVLAYELIVGKPPFDRGNKKATVQEILKGEVTIPPGVEVSEEAKHFIHWALTKDPKKRPNITDLMDHPWVQEHMQQQQGQRKGLVRADSVVDLRHLRAAEARDSTMELSVQSNRMLPSSMSMSAADMMRFRDVRLELIRSEQAKSRAGSSSGVADKAEPKKSNGDTLASPFAPPPVRQNGNHGALPSRKTVVIAALPESDAAPVSTDGRHKNKDALRKSVSFSENKAALLNMQSASPVPPSPTSAADPDCKSPLIKARQYSTTLQEASSLPSQKSVSAAPSATLGAISTPATPAARAKSFTSNTPAGTGAVNAQIVHEQLAKLRAQLSVETAKQDGAGSGPPSPSRPTSGLGALVPSRVALGPISGGSSSTLPSAMHSHAPLYSSNKNQEYAGPLLGEVQRSQRCMTSSSSQFDMFRSTPLANMQAAVAAKHPLLDSTQHQHNQRLISTWQAGDMDYQMEHR